jgi:hypothetical protein
MTAPTKILGSALGTGGLSATFDFSAYLDPAETIFTATVSASVYSGTDAAPSTLISGAAQVVDAQVIQSIVGGVLGVVYELLCSVVTSEGQTLERTKYLAVTPDKYAWHY